MIRFAIIANPNRLHLDMKTSQVEDPIVGKKLEGGWLVTKRLSNASTGGYFSLGYIARKTNQTGFVKVLNLSSAHQAHDLVAHVEAMTTAFSYERELLTRCTTKKMSRVVRAIQEGEIEVPELPFDRVPYLLFEYAESDVRRILDMASTFDHSLRARCLHHVATALQQLHSENIAHQDIKPSNVLMFNELGAKLGDLGRASMLGSKAPHDAAKIAGDMQYAPPEGFYGEVYGDFNLRRLGADMFQLASLAYFLFEGLGLWSAMMMYLDRDHKPGRWAGRYEEVLPHLQRAFTNCLADFGQDLDGPIREKLLGCILELGNPDPELRGLPGKGGNPRVQVNRYVSKFDHIASVLESRLNQ